MKLTGKLTGALFLFFLILCAHFYSFNTYQSEKISRNILSYNARTLSILVQSIRSVYHTENINSKLGAGRESFANKPLLSLHKVLREFSDKSGENISFKYASIAPRNEKNRVNTRQRTAFNYFLSHPAETEYLTLVDTQGEQGYYYSTAIRIEKKCLQCHGLQEAAPSAIRNRYTEGFGFNEGDLYAVLSVNMPLSYLKKQAKLRHQQGFIVLIIASAVGSFFFLLFLRAIVIQPACKLKEATEQIRSGTFKPLNIRGNDELADVAKAVNEMAAAISQREAELTSSNRFVRAILDNMREALTVIDPHTGKIILVNRALLRMYGKPEHQVIEETCHKIPYCCCLRPEQNHCCAKNEGLRNGQTVTIEKNLLDRQGNLQYLEITTSAIYDDNGEMFRIIHISRDITERKKKELKIQELAFSDSLTGLPNRELFIDRFQQAILEAGRNKLKGSLLFIDLDRFKQVNDTHGHAIGDRVLKEFAQRLRNCLRNADTAARYGGDEFVVVLTHLKDKSEALEVARKVVELTNKTFHLEDLQINIGCSIGISCFPEDSTHFAELLLFADSAMYEAKKKGVSGIFTYKKPDNT